jgi:hypothetical protein
VTDAAGTAGEPGNESDGAGTTKLDRGMMKALRRVQRRLERYYDLEATPNVVPFTSIAADGEREVLYLREVGDDVEMALRVPVSDGGGRVTEPDDAYLQLCEGVSHFVYLAERVRVGLPATQLELELQAEVDKFVLLGLVDGAASEGANARGLHRRLYGNVTYLHAPGTEQGERYRLANELAARLAARLLEREPGEARAILRRFYRAGQRGKIEVVRAA